MNVVLGTIEQAILKYQFGIGQKIYGNGSACMAQQNNPTPPECVVNAIECYDG